MEIIYRADDGTTFDNQDDCIDYEIRTKIADFIKEGRLLLLRETLQEITYLEILNTDYKLWALFNTVFYFYCEDDEVSNFISSDLDVDCCKAKIFYCYDDEYQNRWIDLQEEIGYHQDFIDKGKKAFTLLKSRKVTE